MLNICPTNERWLDRCTVTKVNDDEVDVEVPYQNSMVQTKHSVVIGENPRNIRRADDALNKGDRVLVNWKNYGTFSLGELLKFNRITHI